ncbi:MAG: allantoinase AllB [Nitrososphaerales archaeon]
MPSVDLIVENGHIVLSSVIFDADILINEGKIQGLKKTASDIEAQKRIDASGLVIFPGVIDAHVHFLEPGGSQREDFESGTKAAASGGVTTVFEMPISSLPVTSATSLNERRAMLEKKACVDFALYAGAGTHNYENIPELARAGAIGFKTFLAYPKNRDSWYKGTYMTDNYSLLHSLEAISATGLPLSAHSEDDSIIEGRTKELQEKGRRDFKAHDESRPISSETIAVSTVISLARSTGARVHIAHMSSGQAAQLVKEAKQSGAKITSETCPQYLVLEDNDLATLGPYAKVNPPIRTGKKNRDELWDGIMTGTIDFVASDHAPWTRLEKDPGFDDIFKANSGIPGTETLFPLLLSQAVEGRLSLNTLAKITSESQARIFNIYPRKGSIQVGSDADLALVDLKKEKKLDRSTMISKSRETNPYDGRAIIGVPVTTIVRGQVVMRDGVLEGKVGMGKFITPLTLAKES